MYPDECEPVLDTAVITLLPGGVGTVAENWPLGAEVCTTVVLSVADPV